MKVFIPILVVVSYSEFLMAFDFWGLADAAKKLSDIKKQQNSNAAQVNKDKAIEEMQEFAPTWSKLFFFTMQNTKSWKVADVATACWKAKPNSYFDQVENNEFELEKEKNKIIAEIEEKVKSFKASEYQFDVSANIGKYNFKTKSVPIDDILNEDKIILTRGRFVADVVSQMPMAIVTPRQVPQGPDNFMVPTRYVFKLMNPKVFESIIHYKI